MVYPAQSAAAGHTQAMFVYGLMQSRESQAREAVLWMRRAAEVGFKSARLAHVDHSVSDRWYDCGVVLDADLMVGFLDAAVDQVSGFCENMLLGALRRELAGLTSR